MANDRQTGFSLIELMIAIAIVGIIAAIAYPSYQDSVTRSKRTDAKVSLTRVAAELERCFTMNGQYTTTTTPAKTCSMVTSGGALASSASDKGYYTIAITGLTATGYTLTATPNGWTESKCNVYSLNQAGVKSVNGSWSSQTGRCWND